MKSKELDAILENEEMTTAEKRAAIMALNGQDVNSAKEKYSNDITAKDDEIAKLKGSNEELSNKVKGYADYEDLKKYKSDNEAKQTSDKRQAYLKNLGFVNGVDLLEKNIDWNNAKYDEEKQEFTGIDVDGLKSNYSYLLGDANPQKPVKQNSFGAGGNGKAPSGKASGFLEAFYELNPGLKPKE